MLSRRAPWQCTLHVMKRMSAECPRKEHPARRDRQHVTAFERTRVFVSNSTVSPILEIVLMIQLPHVVDCHAHLSKHHLKHNAFGLNQILERCARYGVAGIVYSLYFELGAEKVELPLDPIEEAASRYGDSVRVGISVGFCPPTKALPLAVLEEQLAEAKRVIGKLGDAGRVVAIGEVGLDYFWPLAELLESQGVSDWNQVQKEIETNRKQLMEEPAVQGCLETQSFVFRKSIELARELELPVVVHGRDAYDDILSTLAATDLAPERVMLHCFAGTVEQAITAAERGHRVSLPSSVGYRKKFADVARVVDVTSLVIETDSPYHSPMIGHWKTARKLARAMPPPDGLDKKSREKWSSDRQFEEFLSLVDLRYPGLDFTVHTDGQRQATPTSSYFNSNAKRRENEPTFVRCAATAIAGIKDVSIEEACEATTNNARRLFPALF